MIGVGRIDRLTDVACLVPRWVRDRLHDVAVYAQTPDGTMMRRLVTAAAQDVPTLGRLAPYLWRDLVRAEAVWVGHAKRVNPQELLPQASERVDRVKTRLAAEEYRALADVAFALAVPVAHAASILLGQACADERLVEACAPGYVRRSPYALRREVRR